MSKDEIIAAIRKNKPAETALPSIPAFTYAQGELLPTFITMVEAGGGRVIEASSPDELPALASTLFPDAEIIASSLPEIKGNVRLSDIGQPQKLEPVDAAVIRGQLGVAENGAIWASEADCGHRVLPFITQHLAIVLAPEDLVCNMHEAYSRIQVNATGFGLFIAGPSKTADIEQSLVIGAQGARSLAVILLPRTP